MKEKIVNKILLFITKNKICDDKQIKVIKYGLTGLYSLISKMIVIIIVVLFLDTFKEFLIFLIAYSLLRQYSFGLHAKSSLICWLTTLPIYIGGSLLIKYLSFNLYFIYAVWILAFISFILWAPADTPSRPLIHAETRKKQKIKTCVISIIFLFLIIFINNKIVNNSITLALLLQTIIINPISYKITNTQFNNYKTFAKKV